MYKLYKHGVKDKLWMMINDLHLNIRSAVVVNQHHSKYFPVLEGVRQGSDLSGLLYLVFINDLICEIETCNRKMGIFNLNSCAPAHADDIACIATSPVALQCMFDVGFRFSQKWRFTFNASNSCIVQFSMTNNEKKVRFFMEYW